MKLKIKVKRIDKSLPMPTIIDKGDWVDLRARDKYTLQGPQAGTLKYHKEEAPEGFRNIGHRDVNFTYQYIPLGVAMELPEGFEANVLPRSGTFKNFGIIMANSKGVVDGSYCGDNDEWMFPAIAMRDTVICKGDRICQFRIQLSQKATMRQKIKWLLSSGIEFIEVESLGNSDRQGLGSTGVE